MNFATTINGVRTATVGAMTNVVKIVDFTITGTKSGKSYSISSNVELSDPEAESFIPFADLTEADVVAWVESRTTMMDGIKGNITYFLDKQLAEEAVVAKPLPWASAPSPQQP